MALSSSESFILQTKLLTQYVLNLAKYDQNYDIRDRARFIRQLIVPTEKSGALSKYAKKLFLALKPAPVLESPFKGTVVNLPFSHIQKKDESWIVISHIFSPYICGIYVCCLCHL